jgi:alkanesulfonate monooxygenase SsuD/methylene tetrahydromethanopterin reductase-like flavin-dependent oxidoreductase (luciferase family)
MPDYGHELTFGCFLPPVAASAAEVLSLAEQADRIGLDLVTVQDHPYQPSFLDAWTLLSVIAARTTRVSVMPNVANLPLRPPAVLARSAASLDLLSGGRVELGLGTGAYWEGIEAMGGPRRTPGEAVEALEEAVTIIRALWSAERTPRVEGRHYRLAGAKPGPVPAHDIGIWLGAYQPRMLALTGRVADGWLPSMGYAGPERLGPMNAAIDDAALAAGRSPQDVRRYYNITPSGEPSAVWAEQLAGLARQEGISGFIVSVELGGGRAMARFAEEVAPEVRRLVAAERDGREGPPAAAELAEVTPGWDESTRPRLPEQDHPTYGDGTRLVEIHDHLRSELEQVRELIGQVRAGAVDVAAARSTINRMTMRQNAWSVGAYCESYCRVVTIHHTIEDRRVFPDLLAAEPVLGPVLDRLSEEHLVIHDVLEAVDAALVAIVTEPAAMDELEAAVDLLARRLTSHLRYEEEQLVGPLNRHGMGA